MISLIEFIEVINATIIFFILYYMKSIMFDGQVSMDNIFYTSVLFGLFYGGTLGITNYLISANQQYKMEHSPQYE